MEKNEGNKKNKKRESLPKSIGSSFVKQRESVNMTQKELAFKLSVKINRVARLEAGSGTETVDILQKLCEIFSCPAETFFHDYMTEEEDRISERIRAILKPLEPEVQVAMLDYAIALAKIAKKRQ